MQFHYVAINQQNQQLSGNIHADNENDARKELNKLGFSVLAVNKVDENAQPNESDLQLNKYKFEALDSSGKKILGTITSKDSKHAYIRLVQEYHFKVEALYDVETPNIKEDLTILAQYLESVAVADTKIQDKEENTPNSSSKELDEILVFVDNTLNSNGENMNIQGKKKIIDLKDNLIRIKNSYNTEYIRKISTELLNEFNDKTNFKEDTESQNVQIKLSLESQKMLLNLQRLDSIIGKEINLSSLMGKKPARQSHSSGEKEPTVENIKEEKKKEEIKHDGNYIIRRKLAENRTDIKNDIILWFRSTKNNRQILQEDIKSLIAKRKDLKRELNKNEKKLASINNSDLENIDINTKSIWGEIYYFSGWLCSFYLIYYFLSYYIWTKDIYLLQNVKDLVNNPYEDSIVRNLTIIIFLIHCFVSIQKNILESKNKNLWIGVVSGFVFSILIISNF